MSIQVGYVWCFERVVVYGNGHDLLSLFRSRNMRNRAGQFLGVIKGLVPVDPYRVTYEYLKHSKGFKRRRWLRRRKEIRDYFRKLKRERKDAFGWDYKDHKRVQKGKYPKQKTLFLG